jgi:hypothetical protein
MKKAFLLLLASATAASAQFRNSSGTPFPYKQALSPTDVFVVGTPGVSNYNFTWLSLTNAAVKAALSAQVFDVRNYGANGDDDLPGNDHYALQRAIDEAGAAGGGIVYLPRGTFFLTRTSYYPNLLSENHQSLIVITGNNITIQGAGRDATKIKFWPGAYGVFNGFGSGDTISTNWHGLDNFVMRDLTIESNTNNLYTWDMFQFYGNYGHLVFERCNFLNHNSYYNGQPVSEDILDVGNVAANILIVRDCLFSNILNSAIASQATNGTFVENCIFADCNIGHLSPGGVFEQVKSPAIIDGCVFRGTCNRIISEFGGPSLLVFRNCDFLLSSSTVTNAYHLIPSYPIIFENCTFGIDGWTQLYTNAPTNSAWIYVPAGDTNKSYRIVLRNNRFNGKPVIRAEETRYEVEIIGNYFGDMTAPSGFSTVVFNGGGNIVFANNFFNGTFRGAEFIGYTKPFTNLVIANNYSIGGHFRVYVANSNCVPYGIKITENRFKDAYLELAAVGPTYCLVSDNTIVGNSFYLGGASNVVTRNIFDQIGPSLSGGTSPTNNLLAYNILGDFQFASTKNNQFGFLNITRTNYDFKFKNDVKPAVFSTNVLLVAGTNRISTQFASSTNTISLSYQALDGTIASVAVANVSEGSYVDVKSSNAADTNRVHVVIFRQ